MVFHRADFPAHAAVRNYQPFLFQIPEGKPYRLSAYIEHLSEFVFSLCELLLDFGVFDDDEFKQSTLSSAVVLPEGGYIFVGGATRSDKESPDVLWLKLPSAPGS